MANEGTEESKGLPEKQEPTQEKTSDVQKSTSLPSKGPTTDPSKSPQKNNNNNNNNAKSDTASSSQSKPSTPSSTKLSKGAASIDKYNDLKKKLIQQILKKQEIGNKLSKLEDTIYQKESDYFESSYSGNIVKGFENFAKSGGGGASGVSGGGGGGGSGTSGFKRRIVYTEDDHIFSLSSISFVKNMVKRHGANYAAATTVVGNGSLSNGSASSIINSKDDFDDYEDSIDPTTANLGVKHNSNQSSAVAPVATATATSSAAAAAPSTENAKSETSRSSTPSRKRKARTIED